jgi:hypothetical protein
VARDLMRFLVSSEEVLLSTPLSFSSSLKSCVGVEALRLTTVLTLSFGSFGTIVRSRAVDCCEVRLGRGEGLVGAAAGFAILLTGTETETVFVFGNGGTEEVHAGRFKESRGSMQRARGWEECGCRQQRGGRGAVCQW